jgi:YD repeat-containing protein
MKSLLLGLAFALPISSFALVDMKSANYSDTWTDMQVPGVGYDLRINRTYNSRTLFSGLFGFGWCSDYETKIEVTTENNIRLTECGGGTEINYFPKNFKADSIDNTIKAIMAEVRKRRPDLKSDYLTNLEKDMKSNDFMREEFGRRMNIKGKAQDGVMYLANGHEAENITVKNGQYKRSMPDGTFQIYDVATGHMTHMYDKNQNFLKILWEKDQIANVSDNAGRKLSFRYNQVNKKVSEIIGPNNMTAHYTVKGDDLVDVADSKGQKFKFVYDDVHNLTRIDFPDNTYKALTYNKDKDWVLSFRNRKGCVETYDYQISKEDPKGHFWSNVIKKCNDKITNQSKYEFFHRPRPDGTGLYLYRVRTENNGSVSDVTYHEIFGKPVMTLKDGVKTEYTYYDNGFIRSKREPLRATVYEYKDPCSKISSVAVSLYQEVPEPNAKEERKPSQIHAAKLIRTIKTQFGYEPGKCNLLSANNSDGQSVKLQYDLQGRISQIEDQANKLVKIKYENKFGKPWIVTRPGLGTIEVSYKPDGEIQKVDSKEGPNVAQQVASIFNNLLDIIAPATSDTNI